MLADRLLVFIISDSLSRFYFSLRNIVHARIITHYCITYLMQSSHTHTDILFILTTSMIFSPSMLLWLKLEICGRYIYTRWSLLISFGIVTSKNRFSLRKGVHLAGLRSDLQLNLFSPFVQVVLRFEKVLICASSDLRKSVHLAGLRSDLQLNLFSPFVQVVLRFPSFLYCCCSTRRTSFLLILPAGVGPI